MEQIVNRSLFSIMEDGRSIQEIILLLEGELTPELEAALAINQEELQTKTESYLMIISELEAFQELCGKYATQANENILRADKAVERLRSNLLAAVRQYGKVKAGIFTVTTRKSSSVEIIDEDALAPEYCRVDTTISPNKKAIAAALKQGTEVAGARITEHVHLSIK